MIYGFKEDQECRVFDKEEEKLEIVHFFWDILKRPRINLTLLILITTP